MRNIISIFLAICLVSCASNKSKLSNEQQFQKLDSIVSSVNFSISSTVAMPASSDAFRRVSNTGLLGAGNTASNINLVNNPNYLRINGDVVSISLPYYGTITNSNYRNTNTINFNGTYKNYDIKKDRNKNRYVIYFEIKNRTELISFRITLYANLVTNIQLQSTHRSPIQYRGKVIND